MALRAGDLRNPVQIEHPVETQDDYGEPVKTWQKIPGGDDWAKKEDLTGRELFQAQQISAQVTTQFTLRYRDDVDARMQVVCDGVYYHIEAPQDPDGLRERMVLLCSRSAN
jgi:SPP1 family predicted phage head-tail adaptor